jgi:lipopolysaccharide export system permease protein
MKTLNMMVVRAFLPVFILAILFFSMILQIADVFANLVPYLNRGVGLAEILRVQMLYVPKTVSYALPVSLLFAIAFTLGTLYSNNELISVFGAGVPLYRLVLPFIFIGLVLSAAGFAFEERIVIETFRAKNELSRQLLKQRTSYSNTDVTLLGADGRVIYHVDYYNDSTKVLSGVLVLLRDEHGRFEGRIDAESATWTGTEWELRNGRRFFWSETAAPRADESIPAEDGFPSDNSVVLTEEAFQTRAFPELYERPETFRNTTRNVEEMPMEEAKVWIESVRRAGLPVRGILTEYYKRFSFALTPFIVAFISSSVGGRFKKNILLMSLLLSLVISVVYYVVQMVAIILAKLDYIPPLSGAWAAFVLFVFIGFFLFRVART